MTRDPRHDILFTPMQIGKLRWRKIASTRCRTAMAAVIATPLPWSRCARTKAGERLGRDLHRTRSPSSEITPFIEQHLWDDRDIPACAYGRAMKSHGALAGISLPIPASTARTSIRARCRWPSPADRSPPSPPIRCRPGRWTGKTSATCAVGSATRFAAASRPVSTWSAAHGAHGFGILQHFLSRATNQRTDEYGGSLEDRGRFLREVVEEAAREETRGEMAVSLRMSLHEGGAFGFQRRVARLHRNARRPARHLGSGAWHWENCSGTSRFKPEERRRIWSVGSAI